MHKTYNMQALDSIEERKPEKSIPAGVWDWYEIVFQLLEDDKFIWGVDSQ